MGPWHCAGTGSRSAPTWWRRPSRRPARPWNRSAACAPTWCSCSSAARIPMRRPPRSSGPPRSRPGRTAVGCNAAGVIGRGQGVELTSAVSVWAAVLPGARLRSFHLEVLTGADSVAVLGLPPAQDADSAAILLADPYSFPIGAFVEQVSDALPVAAHLRRPGQRAAGRGLDPAARRRPGARAGRRRRAARRRRSTPARWSARVAAPSGRR